jgi:hypothetical protein
MTVSDPVTAIDVQERGLCCARESWQCWKCWVSSSAGCLAGVRPTPEAAVCAQILSAAVTGSLGVGGAAINWLPAKPFDLRCLRES